MEFGSIYIASAIPRLSIECRPYWEYFGRGVANRTPGPFQARDGVQLQINIRNMSTGVLLFFFIYRSKKNVKNTKLIHFYVPATAEKDTWSSGLHCGWHLQFNYTKYNKKTKTNKG